MSSFDNFLGHSTLHLRHLEKIGHEKSRNQAEQSLVWYEAS